MICSHPGNNATCNQEVVVSAPAASTTPSTPHKTCEQCFTVILSSEQLTKVADYNRNLTVNLFPESAYNAYVNIT